ncbi:hypothetical protein LAZ67_15001846 [Cordylochernes scorpioides]|uniref:Retrovirus-related Pol polyprotein from transposon TNT 1-94 n=1 Tax=Cordylochernes scorpioides TaxID=51811 RepID=A0ABY6L9C5_9ARAC|nr:hypothetical protein LAZ67_15001846 [Cordylochernes scorpioides]
MPDVSQLIIPCSSAKDMWDKLLSVYEQSSGQRLDILYNQFFNFKKDPTDDISKHISKLGSLWNDMQNELTKQENLKLPESMLMCRIINTLPDEYFDFKSVWESVSKEERSVDNLTQRLQLLEIRIQQRDECSASSSTAQMANAYENKQNMKGKATKSNEKFQKTRETRECYFCHRKGHLAKDCSRNVMSLQSTLDKGFEMKMDKKGCKLFKTTTGEVIVEGKRLPGGLYGMLITSIKPENAAEVNLAKTQNVNMLQLWHERFGHQNKRHVQKWLKEQGIDAVMDNEPCEACIYGKQHRLSFGSREQYASTQPGNLIHVDVCGPMQEVSKGGMRYFVCFKDDFTKYRSVYFLKEKSQVIEKLEQFLLETKTTGHIVKEILTDGGKEFVNKETSKITNKYGINHRITMPYTPQQNGSAERENRTLIEAARSMIYAKNMSLKLWAEAVNTATYVLNRTGPTQIEGKTPYELWFDKKPAVDHLRIFGTECFVHVPDEKRRKLDAKSEKGTLSSNQIDEQNDTQDIEKIESNVQTSDVYNLRDRSNISKPKRYIDAEINIAEGLEPKTYKEAMDSPNAQFWKEAMNEEMNSLTENDVYECTTLPPGQTPIDCKWVLKTKLNSKGEITRYKARLVAKGFAQKKGIDYEETFSPVARHDTIRTLLAIAANEDLKLVQFDIKTAFLYGDLQDQIYIKQPEGFNNGTDLVWELKKSLYGLKQSPRCWNQKIVNFMKERCLKESTADPCLFFRKTNDHLLIIAIYVDDGIIAGTNEQEIKEFLDELMFSFKITSEPLNYFLGIEIERQPDGKPIKQETNEEKEACVKWESEDAISQLLFTTSVMPDVSQLIIPCSSAKDMWDKLLSVYEQSSGQRLDILYNQFFNFKKDPTDDISKHISKLGSLWNDMQNELTKQENLKLPESMLMCRIINTLPDEYFDFKSVWESVSKEERSVDNLTQRLQLLEIRIQQRDECSASSSTAQMANAYENKQNMKGKATKSNEKFQKTRETRECYFCHRKGHLAKDCSRNVMSLQSTLDKGFEMKMDKKGCKLFKTTTGEVIVEGKRLPGGLYGMLITSIKPENAAEVNLAKTQNVNMLQLWHERFGHQNKRHVQKWLKEQGIDAVMDNEPCEACIYGKQHRLSFGSREQYASTQPGNLIHVDVCGPMQEVSKGGMRYFVCFKDDFTKYRSVYFLKEKSQVIEKLEQFLLETKTTGHIVKEILTDGGKEFVNKETSKITNKYGINHRITMPYTPQQNGSAERENRTLIEAARSMIYAKNMSLKLWAEAVNTATYVLNRTGPTQIEGKTPYELWFDKKPAVDHLRIFGTECFVHVPDEKRRKLDAKSEKGTLSSNQIDEQNDTQDIEKIESNVQTSDVYNLRDRSNISKPKRYIDAEINIAEGLEPKTYKEAMDSPNAQFWKEAMNEEMNSLTENDVYECTTLPPGQTPIDCKWVLKTKLNSKGEITRYKARLVAKGFAQKKGIDYEETFSPVARHDTIRTLLAIAANEDLKLVQFDIKTAFLYGDLQDQIYIKQPEGFNNGTDLVWELKKSLYGLKQSPRCWNQKIVNFMKERCLKESTADPCLFFRKTNDHLLIIAIYVDDGIIAGTNEQEIKEFLDELMFSFKITTIDIAGAFDNAWWPAIIKRMDNDDVSSDLIRIIKSYLNNEREVKFTYESETFYKKLTKGCPQGGPLSPLLWNILLNDLLINFDSMNADIICYADDVTIICWNKTIGGLKTASEYTLNYVIQWCNRNKLTISTEKTNMLYLHNRQQIPIKVNNNIIMPVKQVKILGMKFSNHKWKNKVNFTPHVNDILCKAGRMKNLLCSLSGNMWGLDTEKRLTLFKTIIRPVLTYGSEIWFKYLNNRCKQKLNSMQYQIILWAVRAYKTTSSNCVHSLAKIPLLTDYIESRIIKFDLAQMSIEDLITYEPHAPSIVKSFLHAKMNEIFENTNEIFRSFFVLGIPRFFRPNFYNIQFITDHGNFGKFLATIGAVKEPGCFCGGEIQDARHLLLECPIFRDLRENRFGRIGQLDEFVDKKEKCKTRLRRESRLKKCATIGRDARADPVVLNPNIDIPKYDGTEDPRPWIESLEEIGFLYHWAEYITSRYAAMNMIGSAKTWLDLHKKSFTSWEHFKSRLIQDFASDANKEEMKMRLNRMQEWNEPAIRFAEDILVLCNKVDPQMEEETKINWVIGGLKKEYSFALYLNPPKNTNELLRLCKKMDLFENNYQKRVEKSKAIHNVPRSPRPHHQEQWKNAPSFRRPHQNTFKPQVPAPRQYKANTRPRSLPLDDLPMQIQVSRRDRPTKIKSTTRVQLQTKAGRRTEDLYALNAIGQDTLRVIVGSNTVIPELSIKLIRASIEAEDGEYVIEENNRLIQTNGLRLERSLLTVTDKKTHIWIKNPYPRPLKIMKDQTLAYGSLPAEVNFIENIEKQNENDEIQFQINKNLSFKEQERLKQILAKYTDLFSSRLGRTNLAKHQIHTEDAKPIKHKPYRVSAKERTIIKDQIDEMLEEGKIRHNLRVPAIDLKSGYWQVEIEERDKEKTAFTTAHGLYEFNVMPFGLCNAPATFERNMDNVLGNLRWQICLCYLDDVIIYSSDFPTHIKRLEAVLRCFSESNLKLNAKKCIFAFEELEILGHITNQEGKQEEAFQNLKKALINPPNLGHFDPNAATCIHTDASNVGLGATLNQNIGGEEKNLKDPTGRLVRWALEIQEYKFEIMHKSGKKHLDADGLSRGPLPENEWDEDYERLFLNQIIDEKDDFIENIKENLSGNKRSITQNLKEENGCLYKKNPNPVGKAWLLVVPKKRRKAIMSKYHNHMLNGHLGVARTTYRLKNKYFWPSMPSLPKSERFKSVAIWTFATYSPS